MQRRNRGATLVEALVAMAVMAFGMLAIVGVQQTLRVNADISKQRSEATRLAEVAIEEIRTEAGSGGAKFDAIADAVSDSKTYPGDNTTFTLEKKVTKSADKRSLTAYVLVKWDDRTGTLREVVMHDMLTRVDPVLSGLVSAEKPLTPVGRRKSRHPTIPIDANDLSDGTSKFSPPAAGPVFWVFNNSTGEVTHRCVTPAGGSSYPKDGCGDALKFSGQLLAGEVRFNLRGGAKSLGAESVFKPISGGEVAWVINHTSKRLVRICPVPAWLPTASLTADLVSSGCTVAGVLEVPVEPFETADPSHKLTASDSEHPSWPSIPVNVGHISSGSSLSAFGISLMECFSDANLGSTAHAVTDPTQITVKYFCLIQPNSVEGWWGRIQVVPLRYSDGNDAKWSTGTTEGTYRVCRYTTADSDFTDNMNHPAEYGKTSASCGMSCPKVVGNLINQNFLIINGTKSCPEDGPAKPVDGDFVNSNTRQHQP